MIVYAVAQPKITDRAAYDRYLERFAEVFRHHPGQISTDRSAGAETTVLLAKGLP